MDALTHLSCALDIDVYILTYIYSGTALMQTPLGPSPSVLLKGVPLFQELFYIRKIHSGPHAVSALQWMSVFQEYLQGGVPLYTMTKCV